MKRWGVVIKIEERENEIFQRNYFRSEKAPTISPSEGRGCPFASSTIPPLPHPYTATETTVTLARSHCLSSTKLSGTVASAAIVKVISRGLDRGRGWEVVRKAGAVRFSADAS
jgi:hypothetical protein